MKVLEVNIDDNKKSGIYMLVRNVIEHRSEDIDIEIASYERFESIDEYDFLTKRHGLNVHYVGYEGNKVLKQIAWFRNLYKLVKRNGYDCAHIHADVSNKLLTMGAAARLAGCKRIILHSHSAGVDGNGRSVKLALHRACRRWLKLIGTDFLSCSDLASDWMFPNISKKDIKLIKNGIDVERFAFDQSRRSAIREQLGLQDNVVIGHIGRFTYQKNHSYLIDIFARIQKEIPTATLLLIGEGELQDDIRAKVSQLGLSDNVIFHGVCDNVEDLLLAMDAFVLPSHFEGLPIVGVEAQASGLPCLFADTISRETKLTDNAEFLPIGDENIDLWVNAIKSCLSRPREMTSEEIAQAGFSIRDTAETLCDIYRKR